MSAAKTIELIYNIGSRQIKAYLIEPYDDEIFMRESAVSDIKGNLLTFYQKTLKQAGDELLITYTGERAVEHHIQTQDDLTNFYQTCGNNLKLQIYSKFKSPHSMCIPELTTTEMLIHCNLACNGCNTFPIIGFRYLCLQCPHFNLCERCNLQHKHYEHMMLRMAMHTFPRKYRELFIVHDGVTCDECKMFPIIGYRYKCIECPDYDICQNCEMEHGHTQHQMIRFARQDWIGININLNEDYSVHTNISCMMCKCKPIIGCLYKCLYCHNFNVCQNCEDTHRFPGHTMVRLIKNILVDDEYVNVPHDATRCSNCSTHPIVGFRYKCIQCEDFDLCELCESRHKHSEHKMVRLPTNNYHNDINSWASLLLTETELGIVVEPHHYPTTPSAPNFEDLHDVNTDIGRRSPPPSYSDCVTAQNASYLDTSERTNERKFHRKGL